jgi:Rrf2 family iron-sulfur cluster assembly transcriptional regulator
MKLNTRSRYAVMALTDLVLHKDQGVVPLKEMAGRQGLSQIYLEQLFSVLRREGFVTSTRGARGGYALSRPPEEITIASVMKALGDPIKATRCSGQAGQGCNDNGAMCLTHHLWADLETHIWSYLSGITLKDVTRRAELSDVHTKVATSK